MKQSVWDDDKGPMDLDILRQLADEHEYTIKSSTTTVDSPSFHSTSPGSKLDVISRVLGSSPPARGPVSELAANLARARAYEAAQRAAVQAKVQSTDVPAVTHKANSVTSAST